MSAQVGLHLGDCARTSDACIREETVIDRAGYFDLRAVCDVCDGSMIVSEFAVAVFGPDPAERYGRRRRYRRESNVLS